VGSRIGGSDGSREAESMTAAVLGVASGVGWRQQGLAWHEQLGRTAGQWAAVARGGRSDDGGGVRRRAEAGRRGDGDGSGALGEAPGATSSFECR
jgi:hypothetical protein